MEAILFLFLTSLNVLYLEATCPNGTTINFSNLIVGFQQIQGTSKTTSFAHVLTASQTVSNQTCSEINNALFLTASTTDCPIDCLTTLAPYKFTNGTSFVDIVMLRPSDLSLYPNYTQFGMALYCVATNGNCDANVPIYGFYSSAYADHFSSSESILPDNTYSYDFSGYPVCFGWKMPSTTADKQTIANKYSGTTPTECYVANYLGLMTSTTTSAKTSTTTAVITTSGVTTTTAALTTQAMTTTKPVTVAVTASFAVPITDSNEKSVTIRVNRASTIFSDSSSSNTWKWVVLGVGVGVLCLAAVALLCFFFSNFRRRTSTNARVNPYDRDLYTTEGMGDAPPVPVDSLPAQRSMPVIPVAAGSMPVNPAAASTQTNAKVYTYNRDLYTTEGMGEAPPVPVDSLPAQRSMPVIPAGASAEVAV